MGEKLEAICATEGVNIAEEVKTILETLGESRYADLFFFFLKGIKTVVSVSGGDLRKAITTLQSLSTLYGEKKVDENAIVEVAGVRCLFQ